ncbi:MAG: hypothetical protein ACD_22C00274G0001 [uncultured bacterium]|nr:MAG: hypothetical protein ACD_22C00274G0001 [uncultured bacterium]
MKKRLIYYKLIKQLSHKNALVLVGMRQVGKTTLMRQIFNDVASAKVWLDLDNPLDQKTLEDINYDNIFLRLKDMAKDPLLKGERLYVFIDEIQNFPETTKIMKYLIDHYSVKFIVTGSSSYYLKNLFPESLSGRKFLHELTPLSFKEYLYFKDVINLDTTLEQTPDRTFRKTTEPEYYRYSQHYEDYLRYGGFPEVVTTDDPTFKVEILTNIFKSFFEKDLLLLSDFKDIKELRDLLILLTQRVGSLLDITKLAGEIGVSRPKVYSYLEFLQGTFVIKLLPKFSRNVDKSIAGGRKVYFTDNGLLKVIAEINESQLFENAVVNQLTPYGVLAYYNKRNTSEIDIILNKSIALEVKLTGTKEYVADLKKVSSGLGIDTYFIISKKYISDPNTIFGLSL